MNIYLHKQKISFLFRCLCVLLASFSGFSSIAQPSILWDKTYGGGGWEEMASIAQSYDGGYYFAGYTASTVENNVGEAGYGSGDFWVVKTDLDGNIEWEKRYGGSQDDRLWKIIETKDHGLLFVGETRSPLSGLLQDDYLGGSSDAWAIRTDEQGNILWNKRYGGANLDVFFGAAETPDNGFLLAGFSNSGISATKTQDSLGGWDYWVLKIDASGNALWDRVYGGNKDEDCRFMCPTPDGNYILAGGTKSLEGGNKTAGFNGIKDYWLVKIAPDGTKIWDQNYGGSGEDVLRYVYPTLDGGYALGGGSRSNADGNKTAPNYGNMDYWFVKTDTNGAIEFDKSFGTSGLDEMRCIIQNPLGNYILAGIGDEPQDGNKTSPSKGGFDYWILYLNTAGNTIWEETYGGSKDDALTEMFHVKEGGYLIGGHSKSDANGDKSENCLGTQNLNDFWILKSSCGVVINNIEFDTTACQFEPISVNVQQPGCPECVYQWSDNLIAQEREFELSSSQDFIVTVFTPDGCYKEGTVTLNMLYSPVKAIFDVTEPLCHGLQTGSIELVNVIGGTAPYSIAMDDSPYSSTYSDFLYLPADEYHLHFLDANNCAYDTVVTINQPDPFEIDIPSSIPLDLGDTVTVAPYFNQPLDTFYWSDPSITDPYFTIRPLESMWYTITAINENGCKDAKNITLVVSTQHFYFAPAAFSPNEDGVNDYFTINAGQDVASIKHFKVFNRWGEMLYQADQLFPDGPKGWDGTLRGREQENNVYTYHAEITYINGFKEMIKGDVMIMR